MNVVGITSWNVCDTETAIINPLINMKMNCSEIPNIYNGEHIDTIDPDIESKIRAMLLTCKPGNNPVSIPTATPEMQNIIIRIKSNKICHHLTLI